MFRTSVNNSKHSARRGSRRRGSGTLLMLVIVLVMMAVLGATIELALVYQVHLQLQGAADTAALAGAVELLDDDVLRPGNRPNLHDDVRRARRAAVAYAAANVAAAVPVECDANFENDPAGDVVVGWVDEPRSVQSPLLPWDGSGTVNTLQVRLHRTAERGNPVALWFTSILGLSQADVEARGQASIDRRVFGFRPTREDNVPLVPLAILRRGGDGWFDQAFAPADASWNDRYHVDERTGAVTPGPDGIPEIELRITPPGAEATARDNAGFLLLDKEQSSSELARQIATGMGRDDLQAHGGQLALTADGTLALPGSKSISRELIAALRGIQGVKRVWPLYRTHRDLGGMSVFELDGFVAGQVVDVQVSGDGQLIVLVQPCLLVTATALTGRTRFGPEMNHWIAKLVLSR